MPQHLNIYCTLLKFFLAIVLLGCKPNAVELPRASEPITHTIIIGSSVAAGVGASDGQSWAELLQKEYVRDKFINLSVPGVTTFYYLPDSFYQYNQIHKLPLPDTTRNVDAVVRMQPECVIVSITTNDIARGFSPDSYMRNMRIITDILERSDIRFMVTSTTLRDDLSFDKKRQLLELFRRLREEYPEKFVDVFTPNGDTNTLHINSLYYNTDKIHPNNLGHYNIYQKVKDVYSSIR